MIFLFKTLAIVLNMFYGYEGINLLFRVSPSKMTVSLLRKFGAKIGNNVRIQAPFLIHNADQLEPIYKNLIIGDNCYIGRDCMIDVMGKVQIESNVTISHRVVLNTHTDAGNSPLKNKELKKTYGNITIEDGAYIGTGVTILEDVVIGKNTIIGAFSLVNKSIPDNERAVGVPCKMIKMSENN